MHPQDWVREARKRYVVSERRVTACGQREFAACIRPDEVFFAEAVVRAVMVNDQIDLALVRLCRVRKQLRAKLGECGTMIETVRGYGYRFEV